MSKTYRGGNYSTYYGYTDPDESSDPETGRAEKFEDFDTQLQGMNDGQWEKLTKLLHETSDSKIVEFLERLPLPVNYDL